MGRSFALRTGRKETKAKKKKTEEDVSDDTKQKDVSVTISDWKTESASVLSDNMALFERMAGIINAGTPDQFILPLLTDYGYDPISANLSKKCLKNML